LLYQRATDTQIRGTLGGCFTTGADYADRSSPRGPH
jgi:hypothetical protein